MRILIVDDEFQNRMLLEKYLAKYGECDFAANGQEAVEVFEFGMEEGAPYDLVCMDIMMPIMDGQSALEHLRSIEDKHRRPGRKETVVFMVSALDTEEHVVKAFFRGGCTDYLTKPVTQAKLIQKLKDYKLIPD
ncbi:MAG: response regulator [Magnetococcales bacterium]|nr:response regulator [Magnetococcales bacterium]